MGEREFERIEGRGKERLTRDKQYPRVLTPKEGTPWSYSLEEKVMASDGKNNIKLEVVLFY